jgi:hypothetical protein
MFVHALAGQYFVTDDNEADSHKIMPIVQR